MGIEFLGNKKQLEAFLMDNLSPYISPGNTFFDLFSGSGSVSLMIKKRGMNIIANDFMFFSATMTKAILENGKRPRFDGLRNIIEISGNDPYGSVISHLNSLSGECGFIYKHFSPAALEYDGVERMYFTVDNAMRIDAIRNIIEAWGKIILPEEKALLILDLLEAVSGVSNIAGTYGCYMKYWKEKALSPIRLQKSSLIDPIDKQTFLTCNRYANDIISEHTADIIYMDPPYTKRQYSAYYHILETVALADNPTLTGKTGLRDWKSKTSDYCYKRKAPNALRNLLDNANGRVFVMSYNNEGQIPHDVIIKIMNEYGKVRFYETPYRRYKSNSNNAKANEVLERLYILEMREHAD